MMCMQNWSWQFQSSRGAKMVHFVRTPLPHKLKHASVIVVCHTTCLQRTFNDCERKHMCGYINIAQQQQLLYIYHCCSPQVVWVRSQDSGEGEISIIDILLNTAAETIYYV